MHFRCIFYFSEERARTKVKCDKDGWLTVQPRPQRDRTGGQTWDCAHCGESNSVYTRVDWQLRLVIKPFSCVYTIQPPPSYTATTSDFKGLVHEEKKIMITKLRGQGFTSTMCSCHRRKQDDKSWLICASTPMCDEVKSPHPQWPTAETTRCLPPKTLWKKCCRQSSSWYLNPLV